MSEALDLESHGILNGLLRLKLTNLLDISRRLLYNDVKKFIRFKLEYKTISKTQVSEWQIYLFKYTDYIRWSPECHFNIRLPSNLYDYQMEFRISLLLSDECRYSIIDIPKNEWFALSNIINITIPSSIRDKPRCYDINDWIRFKPNPNALRWFCGIIVDKIDRTDISPSVKMNLPEINRYFYKIKYALYIGAHETYTTNKNTMFQEFYSYSYIDLSDRDEADKCMLIADESNVYQSHQIMTEIFFRDYAVPCFDKIYQHNLDFLSMAKSVSVNILSDLHVKDKVYKMKCPMRICNDNDQSLFSNHYDATLRLIPQREYVIGAALEKKQEDKAQNTIYYCDICLCRQGEYDWMYHDKPKNNGCKYLGHDICISCVYDMIKKYEQLCSFMQEILMDDLTNDCIQVIVTYISGDVVKLASGKTVKCDSDDIMNDDKIGEKRKKRPTEDECYDDNQPQSKKRRLSDNSDILSKNTYRQ